MGVLSDAGMLNLIAEKILDSKMAGTARGAELVCMMGIAFTTILLGGVTSASILTFGPILNKIGAARNIHPYRRANLLDGTANSLPAIIPFMSVFVFIGSALTGLSRSSLRAERSTDLSCSLYSLELSYGMGMPERRIGSGFPDLIMKAHEVSGWHRHWNEYTREKRLWKMDDTFTLYDPQGGSSRRPADGVQPQGRLFSSTGEIWCSRRIHPFPCIP